MQESTRERADLKIEIEDETRCLIGMEVSMVTYAGNMRGIHFGTIRGSKGQFVGEYALHIQCPWRLERTGKVLTGFHDYYIPASDNVDKDWNPNSGRGSLQEEVLAAVFRLHPTTHLALEKLNTKAMIVRTIAGDSFGGLVISFTGGTRLRVFPAGSTDEHWRLFQPKRKARHFVIDGTKSHYE